jgi:hypothetical protein
VHADAGHVPPEVLGKVFNAVKAVLSGDVEVNSGQQLTAALSDDDTHQVFNQEDVAASSSPSAAAQTPITAASLSAPPPDVLTNPIPGKIGGEGALDAGRAGNPSGTRPS